MSVRDHLQSLMTIPGPTGREQRVMGWLEPMWTPKSKRVWPSKVGNLWAHVGGSGPKLLLQGHADELSFVVKHIDAQGFLWLSSGQAPGREVTHRFTVGQPALVIGHGAPIPGIFAAASGHILTPAQRAQTAVTTENFWVDIGAESVDAALALGAHVGAAVVWNTQPQAFGNRIVGKGIDDRVALALMTALLDDLEKADLKYELYLAATTQEEIGLGGASSLRADVDVDLALALDNGLTGDIPTVDTRDMPVSLGAGPTIVYKDAHIHYDIRIIEHLTAVAARHQIPVQHAVYEQIGSDGSALIKQGIPTALLGPPTRYTHTAFEMIDGRDLDATLELLRRFVTTPAPDWVAR